MATSTAIGVLSQTLHEVLVANKKEMEPGVDPFFARLFNSSDGVQRDIGRAWQKIITMYTGVGGAFKNVDASGQATLDRALTGQAAAWNATVTNNFPTHGQGSFPDTFQKKITLVQGMGAIHIPIHHLQADRLDAAMGSALNRLLKGTAKHLAYHDGAGFYTNTAATKPLSVLTDVSESVTQADPTHTLDFADSSVITGRVGRFVEGMQLDAIDATDGSVLTNATNIEVVLVDRIGKTVTLHTRDGTVTFDDGDYLITAGSRNGASATWGPSGIETVLVGSGTVFNIAVASIPQIKSLIYAAGNAVMEENLLNKLFGTFYDAYGGMYDLDSIITTQGVMTSWLESLDGLGRFSRQGEAIKLKGGWVSMGYAYNGRDIMMGVSRFQAPGQAYICKMEENNWVRYVPPSVSGVGSMADFSGEIQFAAPLMGSTNNFLPYYSSSALTQFVVAPFFSFRENAPEQIPGIKVTGLQETIAA